MSEERLKLIADLSRRARGRYEEKKIQEWFTERYSFVDLDFGWYVLTPGYTLYCDPHYGNSAEGDSIVRLDRGDELVRQWFKDFFGFTRNYKEVYCYVPKFDKLCWVRMTGDFIYNVLCEITFVETGEYSQFGVYIPEEDLFLYNKYCYGTRHAYKVENTLEDHPIRFVKQGVIKRGQPYILRNGLVLPIEKRVGNERIWNWDDIG